MVWESRRRSCHRFGRGLVQGWQISGVYRAQSGYPFTLALNGDRAGSKADTTGSSLGQAPDLLSGPGCDTPINPGDPTRYIRTECFAFPADGVLGTLGRNRLTSPGLAVPTSRSPDANSAVPPPIRIAMFPPSTAQLQHPGDDHLRDRELPPTSA